MGHDPALLFHFQFVLKYIVTITMQYVCIMCAICVSMCAHVYVCSICIYVCGICVSMCAHVYV